MYPILKYGSSYTYLRVKGTFCQNVQQPYHLLTTATSGGLQTLPVEHMRRAFYHLIQQNGTREI